MLVQKSKLHTKKHVFVIFCKCDKMTGNKWSTFVTKCCTFQFAGLSLKKASELREKKLNQQTNKKRSSPNIKMFKYEKWVEKLQTSKEHMLINLKPSIRTFCTPLKGLVKESLTLKGTIEWSKGWLNTYTELCDYYTHKRQQAFVASWCVAVIRCLVFCGVFPPASF